MPTLKRNIATTAAAESRSAHGLTLVTTGASKANGPQATGGTNQIARFRTTPTTAAVIADSAPLKGLLPRSLSMNGAPRKIDGVNVTHVARTPPRVPASSGL